MSCMAILIHVVLLYVLWLMFLCVSLQDMGTVVLGKLESGSINKAQQLVMMPNRVRQS